MTRCAALALTLALAGCLADIGDGEELTDTDFTSPLNPYIVGNGMQKKHIIANGIMTSEPVLTALITNPLHSDTFDPALGPPELSGLPSIQENHVFIRHLVECALDPTMYVRFRTRKYQGAVGLAPAWFKDKPTPDDLEAVSGCMIALNNKLGKSILTSVRGQTVPGASLSIDGLVRSYAYAATVTATPLASFFASCGLFDVGMTRNCGWTESNAFVGRCTPGATVEVGAGARVGDCGHPLGGASGDTVLRVCTGQRACDFFGAGYYTAADNTCGVNPAVNFVCPSSGVFNVMLSGVTQGTPFSGEVGAASAAPVSFPTKIDEVMPVLEGAFYGNLFDFANINPNVTIRFEDGQKAPTIVVGKGDDRHTGLGDDHIYLYEDAWACHDPSFSAGDAYLHARLCAVTQVQPDGGGSLVAANLCVARPLGQCNDQPVDDPDYLCQIYDQGPEIGDVDHDDCVDGNSNVRRWPMTVFLDNPCALLSREEWNLCARK
jgi:hypothetical protein